MTPNNRRNLAIGIICLSIMLFGTAWSCSDPLDTQTDSTTISDDLAEIGAEHTDLDSLKTAVLRDLSASSRGYQSYVLEHPELTGHTDADAVEARVDSLAAIDAKYDSLLQHVTHREAKALIIAKHKQAPGIAKQRRLR